MLAAVDCTKEKSFAKKFDIGGYPTSKLNHVPISSFAFTSDFFLVLGGNRLFSHPFSGSVITDFIAQAGRRDRAFFISITRV